MWRAEDTMWLIGVMVSQHNYNITASAQTITSLPLSLPAHTSPASVQTFTSLPLSLPAHTSPPTIAFKGGAIDVLCIVLR